MDNVENIEIAPEEIIEECSHNAQIENLEQQINELKDQVLRAHAENDNTRKRFQKEKEEALKFGVTNLAKDILSVADNLKRVIENKNSEQSNLEALIEGVDLILKDVENVFSRHGISTVESIGKPFDPNYHQAVFEVESEEHAQGIVVQVVQDGYKINDRLLRPAMVGVAKSKN